MDEMMPMPNDDIAERVHAYCSLLDRISTIHSADTALREEGLAMLRAVKDSIIPAKAEKATVTPIAGGRSKL